MVKYLKRNWLLYVFLLPALIYLALFNYWPMYGLQIAFKDFKLMDGIGGSAWVGLKWFKLFFFRPRVMQILKNTLVLSLYSMVAGFPFPILLAILLNNVKNAKWKKFAQTITYMPHFISTVVIVGMISLFFSPSSGIVNTVLSWFWGTGKTFFMGEAKYFSHLYVWSGVWQGMSGSPIIQNGKIVGAVTHVLVSDPTRGYGIFIENMLEAAA